MNHQDFMAVLFSQSLFADFSNQALNQVFKAHYYEKWEYKKDQVIHFQNECCRVMEQICFQPKKELKPILPFHLQNRLSSQSQSSSVWTPSFDFIKNHLFHFSV